MGISVIDSLNYILTLAEQWLSIPNTSYYHYLHPSLLMSDIKGAFNWVVHSHLDPILTHFTFPFWLVKWVSDFNSNRLVAFSFDGETEQPTPFNTGLLQGSPISPVAFSIYLAVVDPLPPFPVQECGTTYVDDDTMLQSAKLVKFATPRLQERFNAKRSWASLLNISFASDKTDIIHLLLQTSKVSLSSEADFIGLSNLL